MEIQNQMTSQIIKAIVIFDTTYGNTEKIAKSLEIGLKEAKALEPFIDRSYIVIWYWIQEFNPKDVFPNKKKARIKLPLS